MYIRMGYLNLFLIAIVTITITGYSFAGSIPLCTSVRSVITDEDWQYVASHYDLVLTLFSPNRNLSGENERVKYIKSLNPKLTLLVYGSAINAANFSLHAAGKPREHLDWFLRDEAGEFVTDWEYKDALRTVRSYIGDKILLIINGSRGKEYFQTGYYDFFQFADGMCIEGFMGWNLDPQSPNSFEAEEEWKADVDALVDCAKRGKIAMVIGNVKQREGTPPEQYERYYRYITASFLLGKGRHHYVTFFPKVVGRPEQYSGSESALPKFCDAPLGEPRGEYYHRGGVYQRDFERGKVIVNPSSNKMNVELDGSWETTEGGTVVSSIALASHSGVILIKK